MFDLLEMHVLFGTDPEMPVRSYAYHNVEDEDTAPRYESLHAALQDGWQVVSVLPVMPHAGDYFQTFWLQRQRRLFTTSGWKQCMDPEEPDFGPPDDDRKVLVMLNGHVGITDDAGRQGGPWGIHFGWFDHDRGLWYVNGSRNDARWVTHWHEMPPEPSRRV